MGSRGFLQINCEVDIWMSGVEVMQKPSSGGYIVEQRKSVIHISKPDGGARINISNPFLFKVTHENVANKSKSLNTRRDKERGSGREYNLVRLISIV